jgi:Bacterial regulatory protein, arsR family
VSYRLFKVRLYAEFATIGKALASPHRLELLDLLGQGERSVDELAHEIGQSLANTSAHLQVLRQARVVESDKRGLNPDLSIGCSRGFLFVAHIAGSQHYPAGGGGSTRRNVPDWSTFGRTWNIGRGTYQTRSPSRLRNSSIGLPSCRAIVTSWPTAAARTASSRTKLPSCCNRMASACAASKSVFPSGAPRAFLSQQREGYRHGSDDRNAPCRTG